MKRATIVVFVVLLMSGIVYAQANYVVPYILKASEPVVVDGTLDEWNFCFPVDLNMATVPDSGRANAWLPEDNEDCSGSLYCMYDADYLYLAASVRDDAPGHFSDAGWAADAIEFYLGNYDVGTVYNITGTDLEHEGFWDDAATGNYEIQISISYDASLDSILVQEFYGVQGPLNPDMFEINITEWDDLDGYTVECAIEWEALTSITTGNTFSLTGDTRVAATWSLFDMDESENSADFAGYQFSINAPWQGPIAWQVADVIGTARGDNFEQNGVFDFVHPYILKASGEVVVDGTLDEWSFCFPTDMNLETVPDSGRANAWLPEDNEDCSGKLYTMYDEDYLYLAASVRDDAPGHFSDAGWAADAIEFYFGNYDIGNVNTIVGTANDHEGFWDDGTTGNYDIQLSISYDASLDSILVQEFYGVQGPLNPDMFEIVISEWDDLDGYTVECAIEWEALTSITTGNTFMLTEGNRVPATWSLFDMDETENSADFMGYQYAVGAPWEGPKAWTYSDVGGLPFIEEVQERWNTISGVEYETVSPYSFNLQGNYPNPFNPSTTINFSLQKAGSVQLNVFNLMGQKVRTLINGENRAAGSHSVKADFSDLTSGVYVAVLEQAGTKQSCKMLLMK